MEEQPAPVTGQQQPPKQVQPLIKPQPEPVQKPQVRPQVQAQKNQFQSQQTTWAKLLRFFKECRRVMKVIRKPNKEEFLSIVKVSALGLAAVGLIGFILSLVQQLILRP